MNSKVALLWHGDREARDTQRLEDTRLALTAEALKSAGLAPEAAVYNDDFADEVREQLLTVDGVLVWVNPIEQGRDRTVLDAMLSQVAKEGVLVSAHPQTIQKMGAKDVLYRTRSMAWGSDVHVYATPRDLREQLPLRLSLGRPRVLKQYRGHSGHGIWKVSPHPGNASRVRVRHALRGSVEEDMPLEQFFAICEPYFAGSGRVIDQEYQERLTDGMIRCYLVQDRIAGFGHQEINALFPAPEGAPPEEAPQPGPRLYYPATKPQFQVIRRKMEEEWLGEMLRTLDMDVTELPLLWDADFLFGPKTSSGEDSYVLCEINVSSVYPYPEEAAEPLARATAAKLKAFREDLASPER